MSFKFVLASIVWFGMVIVGFADQIVYLDRFAQSAPSIIMAEPIFNPKTLSAKVGEKISFVARFRDITYISAPGVVTLYPKKMS